MRVLLWHKAPIWLGRGILMLALLISAAGVAYEAAFWGRIFPTTYIGGLEVSNLTAEEAIDLVMAGLRDETAGVWLINPENGDKTRVEEEKLELSRDVQGAVVAAWKRGRGKNLFVNLAERIGSFVFGEQIGLNIGYSDEALEGWLAGEAAKIELEAKEPVLAVDEAGSIIFEQGVDGKKVEINQLAEEVISALRKVGRQEVEIPIKIDKRLVAEDRVEEVKAEASRLMGRSLSLAYADFEMELEGKELVELVGFDDKWRSSSLESLADRVGEAVNRPAINGRFELVNDRVADFIADREGVELNREAFKKELTEALTGDRDSIEVPVKIIEAQIRAAEINNLGIVELLGRGESRYAHSIANRIHNIVVASKKINGVLIKPDEVFSFNQTVGDISAATGYKSAYVISGGRTVLGDGGGVCQVSTTLFRAIMNAGLPIVERRAHSYRVGYYEQNAPAGLDATVFAPTADLKFKNDTGKYLLIQTEVDVKNVSLTIDIYGSSDGRKASVSPTRTHSTSAAPPPLYIDDPSLPAGQTRQIDWAAGGARVSFDYLVTRNDQIIFKKTFYSNYQPWQAVYLRGLN